MMFLVGSYALGFSAWMGWLLYQDVVANGVKMETKEVAVSLGIGVGIVSSGVCALKAIF